MTNGQIVLDRLPHPGGRSSIWAASPARCNGYGGYLKLAAKHG